MSFPKRADFCSDEKFVDTLLAEIDRLGADWRYDEEVTQLEHACLLYTSPSPRDRTRSRMPSSA